MVNGTELTRLQAHVDRLDGVLQEHLLKCADANGRLDLKLRVALWGVGLVILLVAPDNPLVKAALAVIGIHH